MKKPPKESERHIESVIAALDVLDCFIKNTELTIANIASVTGLNRSRVMRLAGTLKHHGYLIFDSEKGIYGPGPQLLFLGKAYERNHNVVSLARPILKRIAKETGETVSLYVRDGFDRVVLIREEGTQNLRFTIIEGERLELYAGAGSKVLLAWSPKEFMDKFINEAKFRPLTKNTIIDPNLLMAELKKIKLEGVAISRGERVPDAISIASPVFDHRGELVLALALIGPDKRMERFIKKDGIKFVQETSRELSTLLGWKESPNMKTS